MNHLALYRKYRPKKLAEVVRQEFVIQSLLHQIETNSISHAYLFCGPRGTGKTSVAKIFAHAINCQSTKAGEACGKCATCKALAENNLDIVEIDAASNNGVDEMREIIEKVQYPPVAAKYKVYIIDEVHMLSINAFNALLKTLEEPPKHILFILATTEVFKLPATILSRCMRFDFKLLTQTDIENHLKAICKKENVTFEDRAIATIARAGNGSMRDSLSILDTCISYSGDSLTYTKIYEVLGSTDFACILELIEYIFQEKANKAINLMQKFCAAGKSINSICKDILDALTAIITAYTTDDAQEMLAFPEEIFKKIQDICTTLDTTKLLRVLEIFTDVEQKLRYALTPKILLETAIFKSAVPAADTDTAALVQRIQKLEKEVYLLKQQKTTQTTASTQKIESKGESGTEKEEIENTIEKEKVIQEQVVEAKNIDIVQNSKKYKAPTVRANVQNESKKIEANALGHMMRFFRQNPSFAALKEYCLHLQESWQGDKVLFKTEDSAVYKALQTQYAEQLAEVMQNLGIANYAIEENNVANAIEADIAQIEKNFKGIKIEIEE